MTTNVERNSPSRSSEGDDNCSSDDEVMLSSDGNRRRGRFEIERKPEHSDPKPKRLKTDSSDNNQHNISRVVYDRRPTGRRRRPQQLYNPHQSNNHHAKQLHHQHHHHLQNDSRQHYPSFVNNSNLRQIPLVNNPAVVKIESTQKEEPTKQQQSICVKPSTNSHSPNKSSTKIIPKKTQTPPRQKQPPPTPEKRSVIYINPKFIKRFIGKSIELANKINGSADSSLDKKRKQSSFNAKNNKVGAGESSCKMIDEIDFKTSSKESLQAASKMAIIRLVTECIEDSKKRDEEFNKTLVARLMNSL